MNTQPDEETTQTSQRQRARALALAHHLGMGTVRVPGPHGGTYPNSWVEPDHEYVLKLDTDPESAEESP